jgi:hypothetical protein
LFDQREIVDSSVNDTVTNLLDAVYGQHWIIIYKDLPTLREFYSQYAKRQIEERNGSLLISPYYETANQVRQTLSEDGLHKEASKYEKENILSIMDSMTLNFAKESVIDFLSKISKHTQSIGREGITVLNEMGCYVNNSKLEDLVDYELTLPSEYDLPVKGMCLYHHKDFDRLSAEQKQMVVEHHSKVIKINEI